MPRRHTSHTTRSGCRANLESHWRTPTWRVLRRLDGLLSAWSSTPLLACVDDLWALLGLRKAKRRYPDDSLHNSQIRRTTGQRGTSESVDRARKRGDRFGSAFRPAASPTSWAVPAARGG